MCKSTKPVTEQKKKNQARVQHLQHGANTEEADDSNIIPSDDDSTRLQDDFYCLQSDLKSVVNLKAEQSDSFGMPMYEWVIANGVKVRMEVDTGTYATVIRKIIITPI